MSTTPLPTTARAVVFTEKLGVELQEVSIPEMQPYHVLIDIDYSWISNGTESSFLKQERISGEVPYREGDTPPFPQVPGYQKTGRVIAVGTDVEGIAVGDHVFATMSEVEGMHFDHGGHVSPALTHFSQVWKLPDGADPIAYSGLVLTQVGYNCGARPTVHADDWAVVIGDGMVGQWAAQTLQHRGARVIVLGRHDARLALLPDGIVGINTRQLGSNVSASASADTSDDAVAGAKTAASTGSAAASGPYASAAASVAEAVGAIIGDASVQIVVDSVGDMDTFWQLQPRMGHNSHLVSAGFLGEAGNVDIQELRGQEMTLHCPSGWSQERMDATLAGIRDGWLQTLPLITHHFNVTDVKDAWDAILNKRENCLGVILHWD